MLVVYDNMGGYIRSSQIAKYCRKEFEKEMTQVETELNTI